MAPEAIVAPVIEEKVLIYHTGQNHGPLDTPDGRLNPGQSLSVRKSVAAKFTGVYRHIKLQADIFPAAAALAASEKAAFEAKIKELEGKLADAAAGAQTEASKALADAQAKIADLTGRLQDFLGAGSKKDLDALQEKHADAVPAAEPAANGAAS